MATRGNIWKRPGVYFYDIARVNASRDTLIGYCRDNGFGWVCLQCHNGNTLVFQDYIAEWRNAILKAGLDFGLWGVAQSDPSAEAALGDAQIRKWRASFWIFDAEDTHKTDTGGTRAFSATYVSAFRALQPTIKSALTSYGAASGDNLLGATNDVNASVFDYKSWYDAGFQFHPQAYPNQDPIYEPNLCTRHAFRAGWPAGRTNLIVGLYNATLDGPGVYSGANYVTKLQATAADSVPGSGKACAPDTAYSYSCWIGDCMVQQDFIDLGNARASAPLGDDRNGRPSYADLVWAR